MLLRDYVFWDRGVPSHVGDRDWETHSLLITLYPLTL